MSAPIGISKRAKPFELLEDFPINVLDALAEA